MKKNIQFLLASAVILFIMIAIIDFTYVTKFILWFLWASWSTVVAIMYAIIWRESVDCTCLERSKAE